MISDIYLWEGLRNIYIYVRSFRLTKKVLLHSKDFFSIFFYLYIFLHIFKVNITLLFILVL